MINNCPFELVDGKWKCPDPPDGCGWIYSLEAGPKPPKRNCPGAPKGIEGVLATVTRRLEGTPFDLPEARIRICWDCEQFNGSTCTERGSDCKHFERWIERLTIGPPCDRW